MNYAKLLIFLIIVSTVSLKAEKDWQLVRPNLENEEILNLVCNDSSDCYVATKINSNYFVYKSADQGRSWNEILKKEFEFNVEEIIVRPYVYDENNIYFYYPRQLKLEIIENGNEYRTVEIEDNKGIENSYIANFEVFDNNISAFVLSNSYLVITNDNWNSYKEIMLPDSINFIQHIYFSDPNNIGLTVDYKYNVNEYNNEKYAVQVYNYDIENEELSLLLDGKELSINKKEESKNYQTIVMDIEQVNDSVIYYGAKQRTGDPFAYNSIVWKTNDQGRSWKKVRDSLYAPMYGVNQVKFRNELNGLITGGDKIYETNDGGETWIPYLWKKDATLIEWVGSTPLVYSNNSGIYRLETITNVEELSSDEKFRIYQSGRNLEIAINDPTQKQYSFELYSQTGQRMLTRSVTSAYGFIFQPVKLIELTSGAYFYTISSSAGVEFSGKLVVAE